MTANHHTPHAFNAPLTSAEVNAPLAQLDAAIDASKAGYYYWSDYGVVANGSADDTAAVQAMFDACHAAGGGVIVLPKGPMKVTSTLLLPYPVTIVGQGEQVTTFRWQGAGTDNVFEWKDLATKIKKSFNDIGGFTIHNYAGVTNLTGMRLNFMDESFIHHIEFVGFGTSGSYGIYMDGTYGPPDVVTSSWWNTFAQLHCAIIATGIYITGNESHGQTNENHFRDCKIVGAQVCGLDIQVGDCNTVEDCDFTSGQGGIGVRVRESSTIVRKCRFENNSTGVYLQASAVGANSKSRVEDCYFIGNASTSSVQGILIDAAVDSALLRNNFFGGTFSYGPIRDNNLALNNSGVNTVTQMGAGGKITFVLNNIAAGLAGVITPVVAGSDPGMTRMLVGRNFCIRGIAVRLTGNVTAGTLDFRPDIAGVVSPQLVTNFLTGAGNVLGSWQGVARDKGTTSQGIGVAVTSSAGLTPVTLDATIDVYYDFDYD